MLGQKIKYHRERKGLTQKFIAEKIGVDVSTISKIENSKADPSLKMLRSIAVVLDVPASVLIEEDNNYNF
ncbi:helix-turn-helix domain-containing protein [Lutispora thermophila]|uniref:DNA-binding transcriptional regulator, XRE-family HTH domain n=1 Tax=Lutispora thermophila DSM 19022 TaxID=1122184 RepID=A0A1M6J553_9FIRM|nr:helix-turn-helix transcriptional regulator [Lutispora thermophila]SHJ41782.1 DNA-binding transcriptional regulator, XRE-family HTH domain [Lutispora thermophila DSM 19022]